MYKLIIVFCYLSKDVTYPAIHWFDDNTKIHLIPKDVYNFKKSFETTSTAGIYINDHSLPFKSYISIGKTAKKPFFSEQQCNTSSKGPNHNSKLFLKVYCL